MREKRKRQIKDLASKARVPGKELARLIENAERRIGHPIRLK